MATFTWRGNYTHGSPSLLSLMEIIMTEEELKDILTQALAAEFGIEIKTDHPDIMQRRFYTFRKEAKEKGNTVYNNITCRIMGDDIIHLVNRGNQHGESRL